MRRTPLFECHAEAKARFVDFGGWEMPVQFSGIQQEHLQVRRHGGLFDVSHMGEIEVRGPDALQAVNRLITNDLAAISDGQALYSPMCLPEGGIVDDLVVYRFSPEHIFICCNAGNRAKDFAWIRDNLSGDAQAEDVGDAYAQIAVQGRAAAAAIQSLTTVDLASIKRYWFAEGAVAGVPTIISRTGYTGEDGFELYVPADQGAHLWRALREADPWLWPIGLGARDTLRLEMKYALYGNDIDETTNPLEAGLGWTVKLRSDPFIGRDALLDQKAAGLTRRLVAFVLDGRAPARHGYPVLGADDTPVGHVTSGTRSPSLNKNIGMAFVPHGQHRVGTDIRVQVRRRVETGRIVKPPFVELT